MERFKKLIEAHNEIAKSHNVINKILQTIIVILTILKKKGIVTELDIKEETKKVNKIIDKLEKIDPIKKEKEEREKNND